MADQLACDINFFFFGFYHEFQYSTQIRWLARCYCCLISVIIFFNVSLQTNSLRSKPMLYFISMEYLVYLSISLLKSNKYLLQYYKKTTLIDASPSTYRPMRVCLFGYMCLMFLVKFFYFIKISIIHWENKRLELLLNLFILIAWFAIIIESSPVLFVFALLYTRVKLMRQTLESHHFDCRNIRKHHPRRYIQMYEAITDGLKECDGSGKLQFAAFYLFTTTHYILGAFLSINFLKNYIVYGFNSIDFIWFLIEITLNTSPVFLSAVLADLVSMERQEILVIVLERGIACKNERDQEEIHKLFEFLKSNTMEYRVWGVLPLNMRSLLSFLSFTVTNIIAILQIQDWTDCSMK